MESGLTAIRRSPSTVSRGTANFTGLMVPDPPRLHGTGISLPVSRISPIRSWPGGRGTKAGPGLPAWSPWVPWAGGRAPPAEYSGLARLLPLGQNCLLLPGHGHAHWARIDGAAVEQRGGS